MINYIFLLIKIAFITYLIEFPIMTIVFYKLISFRYLNEIILVTNFFTNITLNGILIPLTTHCLNNIVSNYLIIVFELFIILIEYYMYKTAFKELLKNVVLKKKLLLKTIIANVCSFTIGLLIIS